jgi:RHS repeat-associated protein
VTRRTGSTENPYRFAGEHRDPTGLYKIGQRYYTPELGRWTQPDPLRRTVNPLNPPEASPYVYAGNNPCTYTDPTGALSDTAKGQIIIGVGLGILALPLTGAGAVVFGVQAIIVGVIITVGTDK